jgi:branched-subunit amino acid aminotransferase/4-amino-4-deoxychorismate lyase
MRVLPSGDVYLLDRHLLRLRKSARRFSFRCDIESIRERLKETVHAEASGLRLLLSKDGSTTLTLQPLPKSNPSQLKLASTRVQSKDVFLAHKTTNREVYDAARSEAGDGADAILVNEHGEITETTIMNIAVMRDRRWITPATSCGLLPGVLREELLQRGTIVEGIVPEEELKDGEDILCFNALRGMIEIPFVR